MDFENYAYQSNTSRSKGTVNIQNPKKSKKNRAKLNDTNESIVSINYLKVHTNEVTNTKEFNSSYHEASFDDVPHSNVYTVTQSLSAKFEASPTTKNKFSFKFCIISFILTFISIAAVVLAVCLPLSLMQRVEPIVKNQDTTNQKINTTPSIKVTTITYNTSNIPTTKKDNCSNGFIRSSCDQCGVSFRTPNVKIVGGVIAVEHSWPSMAFVLFNYTFSAAGLGVKTRKKFCGGTLINRDTLLTAAHCFVKEVSFYLNNQLRIINVTVNEFHPTYQSMYSVYLGMHNLSGIYDRNQVFGEKLPIKKFILHPDYDPKTSLNDIAVITLENEVTLGEKIQLACLPSSSKINYPDFSNVDAYAVGWGTTVYQGIESYYLRNIKLTLYEGSYCNNVFNDIEKNWTLQMCSGEILGGKDTCQGDSGGPLFIKDELDEAKYVLVGIVSYGEECALPGLPGIYTRVNAFKDWISSIIIK